MSLFNLLYKTILDQIIQANIAFAGNAQRFAIACVPFLVLLVFRPAVSGIVNRYS